MIKTQIRLEEEQYQALKTLTLQQNRSMASLIRQGVDMLLEADREEKRQRALDFIKYIEEHPEKFRDIEGKTDLSTNHDEYFAEAAAYIKRG